MREVMKINFYKKKQSDLLSIILVMIVLLSPIARHVIGFNLYAFLLIVMASFVFLLICSNYFNGYKVIIPTLLFLFMFVFLLLSNASNTEGLFNTVGTIILFLLSYWLARQDFILVKKISLVSLLVFYVFFVLAMLIYGFSPDNINNYLVNSSRNVVSAIALFLQIMYSASYFRVNYKLPNVTPVITLILAIISFGRTGIALSAALVLLSAIVYFWERKIAYKSFVLFVLFCFVLFSYQYYSYVEYFIFTNTSFKSGLETPRVEMIKDYFFNFDFFDFLLGRDLLSLPIISVYGGNPHNSFVYGHSLYGVFYFISMVWLLFFIFKSFISCKHSIVYIALLLIFLIRISMDKLSLPGVFDYIIFYIIFIMYFDSNSIKVK